MKKVTLSPKQLRGIIKEVIDDDYENDPGGRNAAASAGKNDKKLCGDMLAALQAASASVDEAIDIMESASNGFDSPTTYRRDMGRLKTMVDQMVSNLSMKLKY